MALRFADCVDSDGYFKLDGIPSGTVDLVIKAKGVLQPLATVRNVVVPRSGPASDARLKSLDVR